MSEADPNAGRRGRSAGPAGQVDPIPVGSLEIDARLVGMIVALAVIWIGFNIMSGGQRS